MTVALNFWGPLSTEPVRATFISASDHKEDSPCHVCVTYFSPWEWC